MATALQKTAVLLTPAAAIGLAWFLTSGAPPAKPRPHRTWREVMHPETMPGARARKRAAADLPPPAEGPGTAVPADAAVAAAKGAAPAPTPTAGTPAAPPAGAPAAPPPGGRGPATSPAGPGSPPAGGAAAAAEVDFPLSGAMRIPLHGAAPPLRDPAARREEVNVAAHGALKFRGKHAAAETLRDDLSGSSKKGDGLLYVVADPRAPWDTVRQVAAAAAAAGWTRIALAVAAPDVPGKGRALPLPLAPATPPEEGTVVRIREGAGGAAFDVGGEVFESAGGALEKRLRAIHEDYEAFNPGYAGSVDTTSWIVDGTGATTQGVVSALEALGAAGVAAVRLAGIERP